MAHILIVDDDEGIRKILISLLGHEGHEVTAARDGVEAMKCVQLRAPDVLITDLIMPEKEGIELIGEIRKKFPAVKIIAMSGGGMGGALGYLGIAHAVGAGHLLSKPFTRVELLKVVDAALAPTAAS